MNQDLWDLLKVNNNCRVNNNILTKRGKKLIAQNKCEIKQIKKKLTKNILGDGSGAPTDGQCGGIPQRPTPAEGDEYVDEITGVRFIFQKCKWRKAPCCFQTSPSTGSDFVNTLENGNTGPNLVTPPATGGKFIWCQNIDGTGAWVEEDLFDGNNFQGTDSRTSSEIIGNTFQFDGMTRAPINGDQWYNENDGTSYIFKLGAWVLAPCCFQTSPSTGSDFVNTLENGNTGPNLVTPPATGGKFIWCQNIDGTGAWVEEDLFDGNNFQGTDSRTSLEIIGNTFQFDGMTRAPINGDQWYNENDGTSYIFKLGAWVLAPCCFQTSPSTGSDFVNTLENGNTGPNLVTPPATGGKFIWCQNIDGTGAWVEEDNYDAQSWIGNEFLPTGIDGTSIQLAGMVRPPIEGDRYTSTFTRGNYVYNGGQWNIEPLSLVILCNLNSDIALLTQYNDNTTSVFFVVTPPFNPGKYIWCQAVTGGSTGAWIEDECCVSVTGIDQTIDDIVTFTVDDLPDDIQLVQPPATGGKFIWCQTGPGDNLGEWQKVDFPFVDVAFNGFTGFTGSDGNIIDQILNYDLIVNNDNGLYDISTGCVTIQDPGQYLVMFNSLYTTLGTGTFILGNNVLKGIAVTGGVTGLENVITDKVKIVDNNLITLQGNRILKLERNDVLKLERDEGMSSDSDGGIVLVGTQTAQLGATGFVPSGFQSNSSSYFQVKKLF